MDIPKNLRLESNEWSIKGRISYTLFKRRLLTSLMWFGFGILVSIFLYTSNNLPDFDSASFGINIKSGKDLVKLHSVLLGLFIFYQIIQGVKRLHDAGYNGFLILVPLVNLKMLSAETIKSSNIYGAQPTPQSEALTPNWKKPPLGLLQRYKNLFTLAIFLYVINFYLNSYQEGTRIFVRNSRTNVISLVFGEKTSEKIKLEGFFNLKPGEHKEFYTLNDHEYFLGTNNIKNQIGTNFRDTILNVCNYNGSISINPQNENKCNSQKIRLFVLPTNLKKINLK